MNQMRPDDFTFAIALSACAALASILYGKQIHAHLIRTRMSHHNLVSWNTIIAAFGNHGLGSKALELFEQQREIRAKFCDICWISDGLQSCCMMDKGLLFNSMQKHTMRCGIVLQRRERC
ncbi:hypothetical protein CRYUN_Cryun02cG0118600 [Craigia yunnanensis]